MMKWICILVRSIRGLPIFPAIPIMNPLIGLNETTVFIVLRTLIGHF